ncbi:MAG: MATE family efflux transporter [Pseudomonadota bacterium]
MSKSLTDSSVRSSFTQLWLPMIGGVLSVKAIGVSDAYFVGQLGEEPLAAISFTFPIVMTLISLAIGLSAGASSVLSRVVGDGADGEKQRAIVAGTLVMATGVAAFLSVAGWFSADTIVGLVGASGQQREMAALYMQIWFAGSFFLVIPIVANGLLRAVGDGVSPALLMAFIAILNIGLNPLFIFGVGPVPELGLHGAVTATLIARGLAVVATLILLFHKNLLDICVEKIKSGLSHWREISRIGLPASLSTSLNPFALSIATAAVSTLGAAEVAAFGVVTKIQSFSLVPLLALSSATAPYVGQNSGAGEIGRSRKALYLSALIAITWASALAVFMLFFGGWLMSQFTDSKAAQDAGALYLMIVPFSYAGYGVVIATSAALNGLGRSVLALCVSGGRAMALLAPAAWAGVMLGGYVGLSIATVAANVISGLVALAIIWKHPLTTRGDNRHADGSEAE